MFESQVAGLLNKVLGEYVQNVSKDSLKLGVFKGSVELTNVQLRPEAFNSKDSPIVVVSGMAGSIKLHLPWQNLGKKPVVAQVDRVYLLAKETSESAEVDEEQELRRKQKELDKMESDWLADRSKQGSSGGSDTKEDSGGWFAGLIDTIIGNIQLYISNVHVRLESKSFTAGVILRKFSATTVDANGHETFSVGGLANRLRKSANLERLAVYLDHGKEELAPKGTNWASINAEEWDHFFLQGIADDTAVPQRQYLLYPIDGRAHYERRGKKERRQDMKSVQRANLSLNRFMLSLTRQQYLDIQETSNRIAVKAALNKLPFKDYRPKGGVKEVPREWWLYAYKALKTTRVKIDWGAVVQARADQRRYVEAYCTKLRHEDLDEQAKQTLFEVEKAYNNTVVLLWRKLAYVQVEQEKAAEPPRRRFFGLLPPHKGREKAKKAKESEDEFTQEDLEKFNEVFQVDEAAPSTQESDPYAILTQVDIHMAFGAFYLMDGKTQQAQASLSNLALGIKLYPVTSSFRVSVENYVLKSSEENIIRDGKQMTPTSKQNAISISFAKKPQDESADNRLSADISPSLVTVRVEIINQLKRFFKVPEDVDTEALRTAALQAAEKAKSAAASQVEQRISDHPSLALSLNVQAPKIVACTSNTHAVVDLGSFTLWNDTKTSYKMHGMGISVALSEELNWSWGNYLGGYLSVRHVITPVEVNAQLNEKQDKRGRGTSFGLDLQLRGCEARVSPMCLEGVKEVADEFKKIETDEPKVGTETRRPDYRHGGRFLSWSALGTQGQWLDVDISLFGNTLFVSEKGKIQNELRRVELNSMKTMTRVPHEVAPGMDDMIVLARGNYNVEQAIHMQSATVLRLGSNEEASHLLMLLRASGKMEREAAEASFMEESERSGLESSSLELSVGVRDFAVVVCNRSMSKIAEKGHDEDALLVMRLRGVAVDAKAKQEESYARLRIESFYIEDYQSSQDADEQIFLVSSRSSGTSNVPYLIDTEFHMISPESDSHKGTDTYVRVQLNELTFSIISSTVNKIVAFVNDVQKSVGEQGRQLEAQEMTTKPEQEQLASGAPAGSSQYVPSAFVQRAREQVLLHVEAKIGAVHVMAYEDLRNILGEFSTERLDAELKMQPEFINAYCSLGDIGVRDRSLGEHRYKNFMQLLDRTRDNVLVWAEVVKYTSAPDVPHDIEVRGKLARTQVIFRNRFIQELVTYATTAFSASGVDVRQFQEQKTAQVRSRIAEKAKERRSSANKEAMKLDLEFEAPYFILPRETESDESLHLDLGNLKVDSEIEYASQEKGKIQSIHVDLSEVGLWVASKDDREKLNRTDCKIQTEVQLPLYETTNVPDALVRVNLPELKVAVTSAQFKLMTSCVGDNVSEAPRLKHGSADVLTSDHFTAKDQREAKEATPIHGGATSVKKPEETVDKLAVSVLLDLGHLELVLLQSTSSSKANTSLATLGTSGISLAMGKAALGELSVRLLVPNLQLSDQREGVETQGDLALSSSAVGAEAEQSLLTVLCHQEPPSKKSDGTPIPKHVKVQGSFQQPRLALEPDFVFSVVKFFMPELAIGGEGVSSEEVLPKDIHLTENFVTSQQCIRLTERRRLIGDSTSQRNLVYDGNGGTLELASSNRALIILGHGQHLRFKNVTIKGAEMLEWTVKLQPGASFSVQPGDGVRLQHTNQEIERTSPRQIRLGGLQEDKAHEASKPPQTISVEFQAPGVELVATKLAETSDRKRVRKHIGVLTSISVSVEQSSDDDQYVEADLKGLRVDQYNTIEGKQRDLLNLLEPVDIKSLVSKRKRGQEFRAGIGPLHVQLSVSTIQLLQSVATVSLVPFVATEPVTYTKKFSKIWTGNLHSDGTQECHVTFWNPKPPPGYAVLGSTATLGDEPPSKSMPVVRDTASLCLPPKAFKFQWRSPCGNVSLWRSLPPQGYVALGCVATPGTSEPSKTSVRCVRQEIVKVSEDNESLGQSGLYVQKGEAKNVTTEESEMVDLRIPTGVHLRPSEDETERSENVKNVMEEGTSKEKSLKGTTICEFEKLWTSHGTGASVEASVWRPVCPQAYSSLGDIAVPGFQPPKQSLVFKDDGCGILARPQGFQRVWKDSGSRASVARKRISFWEPLPPDGYVALGHIMNVGSHEQPSILDVVCVRKDWAVATKVSSDAEQIWNNMGTQNKLGNQSLAIFAADPRGSTFIATSSYSKPDHQIYKLHQQGEEKDEADKRMMVSCSDASLLFYDDKTSRPAIPVGILTFDQLAVESKAFPTSSKSKMHLQASMSIFNPRVGEFEPFLESCQISIGHQAKDEEDSSVLPPSQQITANIQGVDTTRTRITLSKSGINEVLNRYVDNMKLILGPKEFTSRQQEGIGGLFDLSNTSGERRVELTRKTRQASVGGAIFENRAGVSVGLTGRALRNQELALDSYEAVELDPGQELRKTDKTQMNRTDAVDEYFAIDLQHVEGIPQEHRERPLRLALTVGDSGFGVSQPKLCDETGKLTCEERVLLRSDKAAEQKLAISLEDVTNHKELASCFTQRKWSDLPRTPLDYNVPMSDGSSLSFNAFKISTLVAGADNLIQSDSASSLGSFMQKERYLQLRPSTDEDLLPLPKALARSVASTFAITFQNTPLLLERRGGTITMRTPYVLLNNTQYDLEIGVHFHASSEPRSNVIEKEIFENERYQPMRGCFQCRNWSSEPGHLLPSDRNMYSNRRGDKSSSNWQEVDEAVLPENYHWEDEWMVDVTRPGVDKHGWSYATDFSNLTWPPQPNADRPGPVDYVRRRRWRRRAIRNDAWKDEETSAPDMIVGTVPSGFEFCLPWEACTQTDKNAELCFRPIENFGWSRSGTFPWCSELSNMRNGSDVHTLKANKDASVDDQNLYLSVFSRGENVQFVGESKSQMVTDWTVSVATPMNLQNRLPIDVKVMIKQDGRDISATVRSGQIRALHNVHPGKPVSLWMKSMDMGFVQDSEFVELKAGNVVKMKTSNGHAVDVIMDVTTVMDVKGDSMPLTLQLFVPYWITNKTPLALVAKPAKIQQTSHKQKSSDESATEVSDEDAIEHVITKEGSESVDTSGEFSINGGTTMMYSGRDNFLSLRALGSSYTAPFPLTSSDKVTVVHAQMTGGVVAPIAISRELGGRGFEHSVNILVEPHITMTNRTHFALDYRQAQTQWSRTSQLQPGERARPVLWEDSSAVGAFIFKLSSASPSAWSQPIVLDELGESYFDLKLPKDDVYGMCGLMCASKEQFSPGSFEIVVEDVSYSPPFCIENRTNTPFKFKDPDSSRQWLDLSPLSCEPFLPSLVSQGESVRVSLDRPDDSSHIESMTFNLDQSTTTEVPYEIGSLKSSDGNLVPVEVHKEGATFYVVIGRQSHVMALGSVVENVEKQKQTIIDLRVKALELSIVDSMPMEILLLSLDEVQIYSANNVADYQCSALVCTVRSAQLDDQLAYSQAPVILSHKVGDTPLGDFRLIKKGSMGNVEVISKIHLTVTSERVHASIHEPIIWKILDFIEGLDLMRLQELPQAAAVDPQLAVRELNLLDPSFSVCVSFRTEESGRPNKVSQLGRFGLSFANINNAVLRLRPIRLKQLTVPQSVLVKKLVQRLTRQVLSQTISLLTGVGLLDSTSKAFGQASSLLDWVTGNETSRQPGQEVGSVQRGIVEGGKSFASSVASGVAGIFSKPIRGAEKEGAQGFFKGLGQGIFGAAAHPASGALRLVSNVTEGVSSTLDKGAKMLFGQSSMRKSPPLAIHGDGVIRSYDYSEAVGQQILRLAQADTLGFGRGFDFAGLFSSRGAFALDKYEAHYELPRERIVILTTERIVMVEKPGSRIDLVEQPCSVKWEVHWEEVRHVELTEPTEQTSEPSNVVITFDYLIQRSSIFRTSKTHHTIRCHPETGQASRIKGAILYLLEQYNEA